MGIRRIIKRCIVCGNYFTASLYSSVCGIKCEIKKNRDKEYFNNIDNQFKLNPVQAKNFRVKKRNRKNRKEKKARVKQLFIRSYETSNLKSEVQRLKRENELLKQNKQTLLKTATPEKKEKTKSFYENRPWLELKYKAIKYMVAVACVAEKLTPSFMSIILSLEVFFLN
jgi:hypothetical protein